MTKSHTMEVLKNLGQNRLLSHLDQLEDHERRLVESQLAALDLEVLSLQVENWKNPTKADASPLEPFDSYYMSGDPEDVERGEQSLRAGELGCLIVAGGMGSRLGFDGPKGMYPVTPVQKKSLFQVFAEKATAASQWAGCSLPMAFMTSPLNHEATVDFFQEHEFFGSDPKQISFFSQGTLPFLDEEGQLFLSSRDAIAQGPDGNGVALKHFYDSGLWERWDRAGVKHVIFLQVDNALGDPFDSCLLGHHVRNSNDVTLKCVLREDPAEKVGVLVKRQGQAAIVEYSEISPEEQEARAADGSLKHACANISQFCFSMDFIRKAGEAGYSALPLHLAHKAVKFLHDDGKIVQASEPMAWKFETFIFDLLALTQQVGSLVYPREECYAPLKNREGRDSIESVQKALLARDREIWRQLLSKQPGESVFELSADFFYPKPDLIERFSTYQSLPHGYMPKQSENSA